MVVENLPALRPFFHHQGEWATGADFRTSLEDESSCHEQEGGAERADHDLLEMEAVPPDAGCEAGSIHTPDVFEAGASAVAIHVRGGALTSVIRHETIKISSIPVRG